MLALVITAFYAYRKLSPEFAFKGHSTKTYRNFCNFNRENFRRDISQQDWSYNSDNPNVLWADWKAKFLTIVNSHAPIKTKRVRSHKVPWVTSELGRVCTVTMWLNGHLCSEMHLTLNWGTLYKTGFLSFSYDFMFDRIICVLVNI